MRIVANHSKSYSVYASAARGFNDFIVGIEFAVEDLVSRRSEIRTVTIDIEGCIESELYLLESGQLAGISVSLASFKKGSFPDFDGEDTHGLLVLDESDLIGIKSWPIRFVGDTILIGFVGANMKRLHPRFGVFENEGKFSGLALLNIRRWAEIS